MSSNPLKAQYARVRQAEDRHAEKLKAKAAKGSAGASSSSVRQPSYTKTIIASADRAAARRAALAAAEGPAASVRVRKNDGSTLPMANALYQIQSFLKDRPRHSEASLDEIHGATGIDVGAAANARLDEALRDSEHIELSSAPGAPPRFRYRPKHGVRDASTLAALISRAVVTGVPRSELVDCFDGAGAEVDAMVAAGRAVAIARTDIKDHILFAPPTTAKAPPPLADAWHAVSTPKGDDLQAALLSRKLLSQDDLDVRLARRALAAKAREEAKKAARPRQARMAARKMTNTHLELGRG